MGRLDEALRQELSKEDAEFLAKFEAEPSSMAQITGIFSGPFAWMSYLFVVVAVAGGFTAIFAGWKFATVTDMRAMMQWGGLSALALLIISMIRIWFWMEIQSNRVVREIKRLQLQIARAGVGE